jgi:putative transposase
MLKYKAKWYGRTFIKVLPNYTSQDCSSCGNRNRELILKDREWTCVNCNTVHDRDVNAALNIKIKGVGSTLTASKIYPPVGGVVEEALRSGNCAL